VLKRQISVPNIFLSNPFFFFRFYFRRKRQKMCCQKPSKRAKICFFCAHFCCQNFSNSPGGQKAPPRYDKNTPRYDKNTPGMTKMCSLTSIIFTYKFCMNVVSSIRLFTLQVCRERYYGLPYILSIIFHPVAEVQVVVFEVTNK
jgi:hypothetical protein